MRKQQQATAAVKKAPVPKPPNEAEVARDTLKNFLVQSEEKKAPGRPEYEFDQQLWKGYTNEIVHELVGNVPSYMDGLRVQRFYQQMQLTHEEQKEATEAGRKMFRKCVLEPFFDLFKHYAECGGNLRARVQKTKACRPEYIAKMEE